MLCGDLTKLKMGGREKWEKNPAYSIIKLSRIDSLGLSWVNVRSLAKILAHEKRLNERIESWLVNREGWFNS